MIRRAIHQTLSSSLSRFPVVALLGSRQVGKTTLAKAVREERDPAAVYLDLELPSDLARLREPELYLEQYRDRLVIIDEIQRFVDLFPLLRALVDRNRVPGRFLILGSASPELIRNASETLAGRILHLELSPLALDEVGPENLKKLWLRGGFPDSFLSGSDDDSFTWREAFISTYLERDIPQLGIRIPAAQLRRFWTMMAHTHGQLWNASGIAASMGVTAPSVRHYLDILEDTYVVRQLQPYFANIGKRLTKSPKVYLRDSGLLHVLTGIRTFDDLHAHPMVGHSWEGFAIEQVFRSKPSTWQGYFFRTSAGAEIDLLLLDEKRRPVAVEAKYSLTPRPMPGFWHAYRDLKCRAGYVLYPGKEEYPVAEGVTAFPPEGIKRIFE
ncbi:MAG: ATP-binding protein [Desulfobacterales bacterium]|nr:ATP-binding protein [Desulfobacterales bacterium]